MKRRLALVVVAALALVGLTPGLAAQAVTPLQTALFNTGTTDGWTAGSGITATVGADVVEGAGALNLASTTSISAGATLASWTLLASDGIRFLNAYVKGTPGTRIEVGYGTTFSTPFRLDGSWQSIGLTVDANPVNSTLSIKAVDAIASGKTIVMDTLVVAASSYTASARGSGRTVTVAGSEFTGQGFNYMPAKIDDWQISVENFPAADVNPDFTWAHPQACQQDARLLFPTKANLLRIAFNDNSLDYADEIRKCLDAFYANGQKVLWLITPPGDLEVIDMNPATQATFIADYKDKISDAVDLVGSHPATAFFTVGNEIGRDSADTATRNRWYGLSGQTSMLQELLVHAKSEDSSRHLWGTTTCCQTVSILTNDTVSALDFWGVNEYAATYAGGSFFSSLISADSRPVLITEAGADRYRCIPGDQPYGPTVAVYSTCETATSGPTSFEDHAMQKSWNDTTWTTISANLARGSFPSRAVFGVTFFMYSDAWWFSSGVLLEEPYDEQNVSGAGFGSGQPDTVFNPEFDGMAYAQTASATAPRPTTIAFDGLAAAWTNVTVPTITGLTSSIAGSVITVSWTTSRPTTAELSAGARIQDGGAGVDATMQGTVYEQVAYDPVFSTSHTLSFTATGGTCQQVIPRSFTVESFPVTTVPIVIGC